MEIKNITTSVDVVDLRIAIGGVNLNPISRCVDVSYIGYSDPESSVVSLLKFDYSIDNGKTFNTMTLSNPSDSTGLTFTKGGSEKVLRWYIWSDIPEFYNKSIRISIQAGNGSLKSSEVQKFINFKRELVDLSADQGKSPFPEGYIGTQGTDYLAGKMRRV